MKVLILFFSATGNTAKIANVIKEKFIELDVDATMLDITSFADRRKKIDIEPFQAVVFGAPIYSWRAPRVVREWMRTLDGLGKKCSMFFTYGGFGIHPTHYSTRQILQEQNFVVVSSADFLEAHTFNHGGWKAMMDRPDVSDFDAAEEYAVKTYKRFMGEDQGILEDLPKPEHSDEFLDEIESFRFKVVTKLPSRDEKDCSLCMLCEDLCPTGAMNARSGQSEEGRCIACFACIAFCPENVLKINDLSESWGFKLEREKRDEETIKGQKSKIYL